MNQHHKGDHKILTDNKTTTYQNLWATAKAMLLGKHVYLY